MPKVFSESQVISAMQAAERKHPPPGPGMLSKQVSMIAGIFGAMAYEKLKEIEVPDGPELQLIDEFLVKA